MIRTPPLRLKPGADVRKEIEVYAKANKIEIGWTNACAGSTTQYNIRFDNQPIKSKVKGISGSSVLQELFPSMVHISPKQQRQHGQNHQQPPVEQQFCLHQVV